MGNAGYVKFFREWLETPIADDLVDLALWLDVICRAAYTPRTTRFCGATWVLRPGQCVTSQRVLARAHDVSKKKVGGFFERIEEFRLAVVERTRSGTLITIPDLCEGIEGNSTRDDHEGPQRASEASHERARRETTNKEGKNSIQEEDRSVAARRHDGLPTPLVPRTDDEIRTDEQLVLEYFNEVAGKSYLVGRDTEYLRERLQRRTCSECEHVVEAAVASRLVGLHPRRVFSGRNFDRLHEIRTTQGLWRRRYEADFEDIVARMFPEATEE